MIDSMGIAALTPSTGERRSPDEIREQCSALNLPRIASGLPERAHCSYMSVRRMTLSAISFVHHCETPLT